MYAYLFPGQGSQFVGMGKDLYDMYAEARQVFAAASDSLGYDMAELCFQGPDEVLNATEFTQPALLTVCVATHSVWNTRFLSKPPDYMAGLSLGEYAALVVAGCLDFADAVRLARLRGKYMQEAVPKGVGTMAAVMGLDSSVVEQLCENIRTESHWVEAANFNSPGQVVVSGHVAAVRSVCKVAKEAGASKAIPLPVSAPFHSRLLLPAGEKLAQAMESISLQSPIIPIVSTVTGRPHQSIEGIRRALVEQVYRPVRFEQAMRWIVDCGTSRFMEMGPGTALAKMMAAINPDSECYSIHTPESFEVAYPFFRD